MSAKICFIYTTWPNKRSAQTAAKKLIDERLVACANILGGSITSLYRWNGKVRKSAETAMILKTRDRFFASVERRILDLHPYECPCIVKIATPQSNSPFAEWIRDNVLEIARQKP